MTRPVRLTSSATEDLVLARRWYLDEAPHVVVSFEAEISSVLSRIAERPEAYPRVLSAVRRALARKFPFSIYYRILPDWIEVIAILHGSRDPRTWQRRV